MAFCLLFSLPGQAIAAEVFSLQLIHKPQTAELNLSVGKIRLIASPVDLKQVVIGNPDIADVKMLDSTSVLVQGKAAGRTNLALRNRKMELIALLDVVVGYDTEAIKGKLYQLLPHETGIEVRSANSNVILSGEVSSAMAMDMALTIARSFAPNGVSNLMQVGGGQQVMLEVRIAEVQRNALKNLGIQGSYSHAFGQSTLNAAIAGALANPFGTVGVLYKGLDLQLSALETEGLARVLAEPNLVALSGEEGSFLVGGEFPVETTVGTAGLAQVSVEYKAFGVGMKFTPSVLSSSKINLVLEAEVSAIDPTQTAGVNNYPILKTRRTSTTVEVADGKSFAIAGLLQSDINNAINKFPGLGNLPVLGALFRSPKFQRQETELVVVVTPHLVKPVTRDVLALPTDHFVPASDLDAYLLGRIQGPHSAPQSGPSTPVSDATNESPAVKGLDGAFGHQL